MTDALFMHDWAAFLLSFGHFRFAVFPTKSANFSWSLATASLLLDPGYLAFLSPYVSWYLKGSRPRLGDLYCAFTSDFHTSVFHVLEPLGSFFHVAAAFSSFFVFDSHYTACGPLLKRICPTSWTWKKLLP